MQSHEATWAAYATLYRERFGLSLVPMGWEKKPLVKWKELQERLPTFSEILDWPKQNLAIVTGEVSNLVVVDCESRDDAEWFYRNRAKSPSIVQTRRGFHLYFRHPGGHVSNATKVPDEKGVPRYDIRGDGGYVLAPPSKHAEGAYKWRRVLVPTAELPLFDRSWQPPERGVSKGYDERGDKQITDALAYISKIHAVSGSGGHSDTFRAARILREGGLRESEAIVALQRWNSTNAEPPWSDKELLHKVREAYS